MVPTIKARGDRDDPARNSNYGLSTLLATPRRILLRDRGGVGIIRWCCFRCLWDSNEKRPFERCLRVPIGSLLRARRIPRVGSDESIPLTSVFHPFADTGAVPTRDGADGSGAFNTAERYLWSAAATLSPLGRKWRTLAQRELTITLGPFGGTNGHDTDRSHRAGAHNR